MNLGTLMYEFAEFQHKLSNNSTMVTLSVLQTSNSLNNIHVLGNEWLSRGFFSISTQSSVSTLF
jgi:hypothetical protein